MEKYQDQTLSFEERAKDLVSKMTLEEKCSQTVYNAPAIERLGIPAYNWWNEALHGVARAGVATVFPQAIGLAATFDEDLLEKIGDVISTEGRAKYNSYAKEEDRDIYKGLTFWSPNVNIFRDPRWGRGHETFGEDPYLTSRLGVGFVHGLQGRDPKYLKSAACAKHFAVHSGPEGKRHEFDAIASPQDMRETYLPAFRACVKEAKVETVMGAYNRTNGEPCCGSKTLLTDILRNEWGFGGHVVSDCWALVDFHENHKVTHTAPESAAMAMNNGCDLNCGVTYLNLQIAVKEGLITEETIDKAVTRLMMTRMRLGLFDDTEKQPYANIPFEENDTPAHRALAYRAAKESIVLLQNKNNFLPLKKEKIRSIAVVGPNADSRSALIGNYHGTASQYVTVLDGIRNAVGDVARIYYSEGAHLFRDRVEGLAVEDDRISEAVICAKHADVTVVCVGLDETLEGEQGDASNFDASGDKLGLELPASQRKLLDALVQTGKPVICVLLAGSAINLSREMEGCEAILDAFYPGAQGGNAVADILFGNANPCGKLPITFYRSDEDLPDFEDYSMDGRTYRYMNVPAQFPFGFGLSYTKFSYRDLSVGEDLTATVTVKNEGDRDGMETVQVYVKTEAPFRAPRYQLKKIKKVFLRAGEEQTLSIPLQKEDFMLYNEAGEKVLPNGKKTVFVGGSQPDCVSEALLGQAPLKAIVEE